MNLRNRFMRRIFSKMALALAAVVVFSACGASGDGDKAPKGEFGLQQLNVASPDKD